MRNVNVLASYPVLLLGHFPFLSMVALIWDCEVDWLLVTYVAGLFVPVLHDVYIHELSYTIKPSYEKTYLHGPESGPKVIKLFSCSAQLRLKFILLINVKMPTIVGILTFMSRINYQFLRFEPEFSTNFDYFSIYEQFKFQSQLS